MGRKEDQDEGSGKSPQKSPKRSQIDDNLKRVYEEMLDEDVPDRFEELLRQLREQDQS
jgi:hypothetical protein